MSSDFFAFVQWYLAISLLGVLALPLTFRFFRRLPDRGYPLARTVGLLLASYLFWLCGCLGLLHNDVAGFLLAAAVVGAVGVLWLGRTGLAELAAWLKAQWRVVVAVEVVFLVAFATLTVVRAYNPELNATERPMEFMFLNSILRSDTFPPHDAWLSGNPITYYYFGYVMIAALTRLTGLASEVAFNLGFAMLFALTAVGALSVVMNLVALVKAKARPEGGLWAAFGPALLAPTLVLLVGNFYGGLMLLHANGVAPDLKVPALRYYFGTNDPANAGNSAADLTLVPQKNRDTPGLVAGWVNIWDWLDLKQLEEPLPAKPGAMVWDPSGWWWFSGARVVHDRDLTGAETEAIDEMPAFSFILGDMHPHVLALPFVMLALALALDWLLWEFDPGPALVEAAPVEEEGKGRKAARRRRQAQLRALWDYWRARLGLYAGWISRAPDRVLGSALILGGLAFINTWDFPIYAFLAGTALACALALRWGWATFWRHWLFPVLLMLTIAALGVGLYLPYYLTAQSQVQGLLPNLIYPTRFQQTVVMFGPVMLGMVLFVGWLAFRNRAVFDRQAAWWAGGGVAGLLALGVGALSVLALGIVSLAAALNVSLEGTLLGAALQFAAPLDAGHALWLTLQRRLVDSWATLFPAVVIGVTVGLGVGVLKGNPVTKGEPAEEKDKKGPAQSAHPPSEICTPPVLMALLMTLVGALLLLGPEWVYVHDDFGTRMNTLFKFYYQTWILWALVSAFGLWYLWQRAGAAARGVAGTLMGLAMVLGLLYTLPGIASKANHFAGPPTLDGMAFFEHDFPDDWAAIQWLRQNVTGTPVIAEGTLGAYWVQGRYSRISMATGLPTLLGWRNHEEQWHKVTYRPALRERERYVCGVYRERTWAATQAILDKFNVEYVFLSSLEKTYYRNASSAKFDQGMRLVYQHGDVSLYQRLAGSPPAAAQALPDVSQLCTDLVPN